MRSLLNPHERGWWPRIGCWSGDGDKGWGSRGILKVEPLRFADR